MLLVRLRPGRRRVGAGRFSRRYECGRASQETDVLGECQAAGVVDGVGGRPHVGAPGVRAGFAAAAGLLLAAERATDLGAGGADVDVGDSAVGTLRGKEASRPLCWSRVKMAGGQDPAGRRCAGRWPPPRCRRSARTGWGRRSPRGRCCSVNRPARGQARCTTRHSDGTSPLKAARSMRGATTRRWPISSPRAAECQREGRGRDG